MMRFHLAGLALLALSACGEKSKEPSECCAIEPEAKCLGQMSASGVTGPEMKWIEIGNGCANADISEARIRKVAKIAADLKCTAALGLFDVEERMTSDLCRPAPGLGVDDEHPGMPSDNPETPECRSGLKARGLNDKELWVMLHPPEGICPNLGVTEARIREIMARDWEAAGCRKHTQLEMLRALNSGACGGDAG